MKRQVRSSTVTRGRYVWKILQVETGEKFGKMRKNFEKIKVLLVRKDIIVIKYEVWMSWVENL